jgi:hypothetical protein
MTISEGLLLIVKSRDRLWHRLIGGERGRLDNKFVSDSEGEGKHGKRR